jgi:hypothetical protein
MSEHGSAFQPETPGAPRRGLFTRRPEDETHTHGTGTMMQERLADSLQRAVDDRLEDGLRAIEEQATVLMREIAGEVWRASAGDARPEQDRIVSLLSRDQAIKSLIISSDERFQALAVRTARLEDTLTDLAETGRATREAMSASAAAIREIAESPTLHGVDVVRTQLELVERHIAETFQHLDERDRHLTESVLRQVQDHGDLIARETSRIVEAMQGYVQGGTEAMGQLAQRIEAHAQTFALRDEHVAERVSETVAEAVRPVEEQLELLTERVGLRGRDQDEIRAAIERLVEARMRGLAQLIRSDSETLRGLIDERSSAQETTLLALLEGKMEALSRVVEAEMGTMARSTGEQVLALSSALAGAIDRSFSRLGDQVDGKLDDVTEIVAQRAAEATDASIASSIGTSIDRMDTATRALDGVDTMLAESQAASEERMLARIDERMVAIAKLVRSDNRALGEKLTSIERAPEAGGDPELLRHLLRVVKELQAGLSNDLSGTMDRRLQGVSDQLHAETQSTAEAMIKVAEVLGQKMDRLAVRVDEGYGNDLQVVVERMGDAITAMSGRGRREQGRLEA